MWKDALTACRKEGADLISIHNIEEHSFIISQSGYCKSTYLHILFGLAQKLKHHDAYNHNKISRMFKKILHHGLYIEKRSNIIQV